ncbi:MAG: hypothetical protein ACRD18_03025 [Terriglobia bacterium]
MKSTMAKSVLGVAVALFFATGLVFAKSENVNLIYRGEVGNNVMLAPGKYKVVINSTSPSPEASFYQSGKLVGTTPVKVVAEAQKNNQTEVYYSSPVNQVRQITQIDFSGQRDHLVFNKS